MAIEMLSDDEIIAGSGEKRAVVKEALQWLSDSGKVSHVDARLGLALVFHGAAMTYVALGGRASTLHLLVLVSRILRMAMEAGDGIEVKVPDGVAVVQGEPTQAQ